MTRECQEVYSNMTRDFRGADLFSPREVLKTYKKYAKESRSWEELAALTVFLNHSMWYWWNRDSAKLNLYHDLFSRSVKRANRLLKGSDWYSYKELTTSQFMEVGK